MPARQPRAAARLAAGSRALPPGGRPASPAAHGGAPRRAPARTEAEKCQLEATWEQPWDNLRRAPDARRPEERAAGAGRPSAPAAGAPTPRQRGLPGCGRAEPAGRAAPGAQAGWLPGRAEVRRAAPGSSDGAGRRRGLRNGPGARAGLTAVTEAPREQEGRVQRPGRGGPPSRLPPALGRPHRRRRRRLRPRALRCHEPEGGGRSRESPGSGARRAWRPVTCCSPGQRAAAGAVTSEQRRGR